MVRGHVLVNCAGLHCDRVARLAGDDPKMRIVPFRGEYYELARPELVRGLVYPVPDPAFPFLGVHLTRGVDGGVHVGPNAVLAGAREGYSWPVVRPADLAGTLAWPGFWHLARRHAGYGLGEVGRSLSKAAFTRAVRRLLPAVREDDLVPAPAGVRAQAVLRDGTLVDDFLIRQGPSTVHVLNAPPPPPPPPCPSAARWPGGSWGRWSGADGDRGPRAHGRRRFAPGSVDWKAWRRHRPALRPSGAQDADASVPLPAPGRTSAVPGGRPRPRTPKCGPDSREQPEPAPAPRPRDRRAGHLTGPGAAPQRPDVGGQAGAHPDVRRRHRSRGRPGRSHFERRIRSFQPRRSRVTTGQEEALRRLWPTWGIDVDGQRVLDLDAMFGGSPWPWRSASAWARRPR
ncbi:FAD-dependent oxidoreductase [Actinomadura keratinilytica]